MIQYKAGYKYEEDGVSAFVLDFPGAFSCGNDLDDARFMLSDALSLMASRQLERGELLPRPDPDAIDPELEMDLIEPIYLMIAAGTDAAHPIFAAAQ